MKFTIDRIEGDYIVAELPDGSFANLPLVFVPDAKEGDIILIEPDREETQKHSEDIRARMNRLFDR